MTKTTTIDPITGEKTINTRYDVLDINGNAKLDTNGNAIVKNKSVVESIDNNGVITQKITSDLDDAIDVEKTITKNGNTTVTKTKNVNTGDVRTNTQTLTQKVDGSTRLKTDIEMNGQKTNITLDTDVNGNTKSRLQTADGKIKTINTTTDNGGNVRREIIDRENLKKNGTTRRIEQYDLANHSKATTTITPKGKISTLVEQADLTSGLKHTVGEKANPNLLKNVTAHKLDDLGDINITRKGRNEFLGNSIPDRLGRGKEYLDAGRKELADVYAERMAKKQGTEVTDQIMKEATDKANSIWHKSAARKLGKEILQGEGIGHGLTNAITSSADDVVKAGWKEVGRRAGIATGIGIASTPLIIGGISQYDPLPGLDTTDTVPTDTVPTDTVPTDTYPPYDGPSGGGGSSGGGSSSGGGGSSGGKDDGDSDDTTITDTTPPDTTDSLTPDETTDNLPDDKPTPTDTSPGDGNNWNGDGNNWNGGGNNWNGGENDLTPDDNLLPDDEIDPDDGLNNEDDLLEDDDLEGLEDDESIYTIPMVPDKSSTKVTKDGINPIPILAGLGLAAAAGVGAKIYLDNKKNNDNDEDGDLDEDDEFMSDSDYDEFASSDSDLIADDWTGEDSEEVEESLDYEKPSFYSDTLGEEI